MLLEVLSRLDARVLLATAQHQAPAQVPDNVTLASYVAGQDAARLADLVITNGGSSTGYQALREGTPVLGIASNLDQYLAMDGIERSGAGMLVRAGLATKQELAAKITALLSDAEAREAAVRVARAFERYPATERFASVLESIGRSAAAARMHSTGEMTM
jgi:UDP:flavonoid glycosyltransferase YjiC (YdhE family)